MKIIYHIAQNFRWIKISLNAHALYWHKKFAEFNFAHSASCSPGSSGWSSRMNMSVRHGRICGTVFARARASAHGRSPCMSLPSYFPYSSLAACRLQQRWPLRWRKEIAPPIGVRKDRVKPEEQRGNRIVVTSGIRH